MFHMFAIITNVFRTTRNEYIANAHELRYLILSNITYCNNFLYYKMHKNTRAHCVDLIFAATSIHKNSL